jgi:Domain of unknown function (DUF4424)
LRQVQIEVSHNLEVSHNPVIAGNSLAGFGAGAFTIFCMPSRIYLILPLAASAIFLIPQSALADDGAASIAAGGLVPRREVRIVMAKEVLRISEKKVVVDYDFRNDSAEDVITEVAFPVPPYEDNIEAPPVSLQSFSDFRLLVDGKPIAYDIEAKATLKGKDVTNILNADHIDVATFGHWEGPSDSHGEFRIRDFGRLPKAEQRRLLALGLFDSDPLMATWTVHLNYHWSQTFPAHSTVHIRHEYTPVVGFSYETVESLKVALDPAIAKQDSQRWRDSGAEGIADFCADPELLRGLVRRVNENPNPEGRGSFYAHWVDFILTTANTWRRPIEDFTLNVERSQPDADGETLITFCTPAPVQKMDANHFQMHLSNYVPTSELHIGFFDLPARVPNQPAFRKR